MSHGLRRQGGFCSERGVQNLAATTERSPFKIDGHKLQHNSNELLKLNMPHIQFNKFTRGLVGLGVCNVVRQYTPI